MSARDVIDAAVADIRPPDEAARDGARGVQSRLTKPAGALGRLEDLHVWAAGLRRDPRPTVDRPAIVVAAADHGVAVERVSAYPQDVTPQMVANMLAGGAAVCVLADHAGAEVHVVDAGVLVDVVHPRLRRVKVRAGTSSITNGTAMSRDDAETLVASGIDVARELCDGGVDVIGLGDMGIGNTTPAAAITSVVAGLPASATVGRGTGVDHVAFQRKLAAVERAIEVNRPDRSDGIDVVGKVGGCEIAFLAGVAVGAASRSVPVVLDGYPTTAAALVADAIAPASRGYMLASHVSAEPGHHFALDHLGLEPLLDLRMRLGEGTGAALAISLLRAALRLPREMATFDSAGVSRSTGETIAEA